VFEKLRPSADLRLAFGPPLTGEHSTGRRQCQARRRPLTKPPRRHSFSEKVPP